MIVRELIMLLKPRITLLSVTTAAIGLWLAPGKPSASLAVATLVGTLRLVGSRNTLNMYLERDVDGKMARTRNRPLPAGRLAPPIALWFGIVQAVAAIPTFVLGAGAAVGVLGSLALVLYALVYTPLKRKTTLSLYVGAIPGAMPPLMGWTAQTGHIEVGALALFAVMFVWQVPHFLAIALYQRKDYEAAGLKILPTVVGEPATKRVILFGLVVQVAATILLVPLGVGGFGYLVGALILGAFMLGIGLYGLRADAGTQWARGLFLASVVYLPLLFGPLFV